MKITIVSRHFQIASVAVCYFLCRFKRKWRVKKGTGDVCTKATFKRMQTLRSAQTRGHVAGTWSGDKTLRVYAWDACYRESTRAGAEETDRGIKMCCKSSAHDATLKMEVTLSLLHDARIQTSWIAGTKFCPRDRTFFAKTEMSHEQNCRCNMSALHVRTTCP